MRHTITTTIINTASGTAGSTDGVMMMVIKGVASTAGTKTLVLDTAYLGSSMDDFETGLGITSDYDYVNNVAVYQQVKEFYDQAGDGAYLWLVVTSTSTVYNTYVAGTTFQNLIRGTIASDPAMRVKMVGLGFAPPTVTQSTSDFPSEVLATITALQSAQEDLFVEGFSFSSIIDGYNMSSTATPTTLQSMAVKAAPSVSLCITGSKPNGISSIGAALGRFASISIGHGFGEVDDGAVEVTTAYLTNGVLTPIVGTVISQGTDLIATHTYMVVHGPAIYNGVSYSVGDTFTVITGTLGFTGTGSTVVDLITTGTVTVGHTYQVLFGPITYNNINYSAGDTFIAVTGQTTFTGGIVFELVGTDVTKLYAASINSLGDKQYMFLRTWFGQSGLFWNDGATCDLSTKPLSTQEFNRVANALSADLLTFITLLMGKNVPIDSSTNAVALSFTKAKEEDFQKDYIDPLTIVKSPNTVGDISSGSLSLTGTKSSANTVNWTYTLTINGTPITGSAVGTIQFSS
jgi:hypothetical protein